MISSGFSATFWQMILTRCLSGALNGNVAVVRAAIGDLTDDSNSTDAFAMYGLVWVIGSIFGNTIGGFLSHPTERLPNVFGGFELLKEYPFLLPCLCTTCMTLCGLLFAWVALKEVMRQGCTGRVKVAEEAAPRSRMRWSCTIKQRWRARAAPPRKHTPQSPPTRTTTYLRLRSRNGTMTMTLLWATIQTRHAPSTAEMLSPRGTSRKSLWHQHHTRPMRRPNSAGRGAFGRLSPSRGCRTCSPACS